MNPYNDEIIGEVELAGPADVERALQRADAGYRINRDLPRWRRADFLSRAAAKILDDAEALARLIALEAGKPLKQARKEVRRAANTMQLCAEEAKRLAGEILPFDSYDGNEGWTGHFTREPLGIIVGITPFNDPLNLVAHKIGPALAAGNSIIVKPSEHTPLSAIRLAEILVESGAPAELVTILVGDRIASEALVRDRRPRMVSFTGGMDAAAKIMAIAGIKRFAMDLGGNAPVIVMQDADLERAVESCVSGAFWASGQNCIGVQRIFVQSSIAERFCNRFVSAAARLKVGDPLEEGTDIGPLITQAHASRVEEMIQEALARGAVCLHGNERKDRMLSPTVLFNTPLKCRAWSEEIFGPVVNIESFETLDAAIARANAPEFSLHAGIFTRDLSVARRASNEIEASGIIINASSDFRFDGMPFGGYKLGSVGREGVRFAMHEMTQTKTVAFAPG